MSTAIVVANHRQCLRHAPFVLQLHLSLHGVSFLQKLPHSLPGQGGCVSVDGIKQTLEKMTGIPVAQPLFSSVGRVMHADFFVKDFDELHTVYDDSTLGLCKSGDTNAEQAHRRMAVQVNITGEYYFTLAVQGRDPLRLPMQVLVLYRTGYAPWQQRLTVSEMPLFLMPKWNVICNPHYKCVRQRAPGEKVCSRLCHLPRVHLVCEHFEESFEAFTKMNSIQLTGTIRYEASCKKT